MDSAADGRWMAAARATIAHALYVPERPWRLAPRPEVTVRGALGNALFDVACARDHRACDRCDLRKGCVIPTWFEPGRGGQAARPYVVAVDAPERVSPDRPLRVSFVWFGAIPRRSALVEALVRMGAAGLGGGRVPHALAQLWVHGDGAPVVVVDGQAERGAWPDPAPLARLARLPVDPPVGARVTLRTPTALASDDPSPADVLVAGMLRLRALGRAHGWAIERRWPDPAGLGAWVSRERIDGSRWSQRQRGRQSLSGWVGEFDVGPEVAPFADLLAALELTHVGRGSSAGMGRLAVSWR